MSSSPSAHWIMPTLRTLPVRRTFLPTKLVSIAELTLGELLSDIFWKREMIMSWMENVVAGIEPENRAARR